MVTQYPHTLIVTPSANSSYNDATGNWTDPAPGEHQEYPCRAEPVTSQQGFQKTEDGGTVNYAWTVYTKGKPGLVYGQKVTVMDGEQVLFNDTVKRYSQGQFNTRIWL